MPPSEYDQKKEALRRAAQDEQASRYSIKGPGAMTATTPRPQVTHIKSPPFEREAAATADVSAPIVSERLVLDHEHDRRAPAPTVVTTKKGAGGYEYAELSDGSYKILKSPTTNEGKIVKPGTKGYEAIKAEMTAKKPRLMLARM